MHCLVLSGFHCFWLLPTFSYFLSGGVLPFYPLYSGCALIDFLLPCRQAISCLLHPLGLLACWGLLFRLFICSSLLALIIGSLEFVVCLLLLPIVFLLHSLVCFLSCRPYFRFAYLSVYFLVWWSPHLHIFVVPYFLPIFCRIWLFVSPCFPLVFRSLWYWLYDSSLFLIRLSVRCFQCSVVIQLTVLSLSLQLMSYHCLRLRRSFLFSSSFCHSLWLYPLGCLGSVWHLLLRFVFL